MKPTMFFLINSIDILRGGLTRASLKQASFFAEMGYETYMLTFNFNPKYPIIRDKLLEMNKVHKNVTILNMYEELEGYDEPLTLTIPSKKASLTELSNGMSIDKRHKRNAYRVYNNGLYVKYISLNEDNSLDFIDYFDENRYRTKREVYDPWGNLKKVAFMNLLLNKPNQLIYYDNEGRAYFSQWNDPESEIIQRVNIFNKNSSITHTYANDNVTHKLDWLTKTINKLGGERSVVISDTRSTDEVLIKLDHPKAAKVWRLHSSHLDSPFTVDANITPAVKPALDNLETFDAAVFLTEEQKNDVTKRLGEKSNLMVIPHYHEESTKTIKSNNEDNKLGVVISRLSSLKRLDHTINAFKYVVDEIPDARLEIWGTGNQESSLKKLIKELNLKENVYLKGYTHNPDEIYQKALFSVMTSKKEGFALSVLESMYNKAPVISYEIKYGPTDMIVDNENGYIIENENIEELANKMIYMFKNPDKSREMGEKSRNYIDKHFNKNIYKQKWLDVIDAAITTKFRS
ncbi:glycosyltransferase [Virgibacillus litoralis]|uniref:Poly(Glycerol-phosphate) alpha-glucosyltransferase n=1 Tax=Virgibacillus litoralis TaxID=578221 RepID=A0ABS4HI25_9BACI|nr:glycosyltransferase [Virgibacillus litoralis]MBP1950587.1 poly(glycerol-phosphate) alpha-glucosyltransferase [Virgibacillus litoralis]